MSTPSPSLIIVGPQACGKSVNAQALKEHFKLDIVIEHDFPSPHLVPDFNALVLCNELPKSCNTFRSMKYSEAILELKKAGKNVIEQTH